MRVAATCTTPHARRASAATPSFTAYFRRCAGGRRARISVAAIVVGARRADRTLRNIFLCAVFLRISVAAFSFVALDDRGSNVGHLPTGNSLAPATHEIYSRAQTAFGR